MLVGLVALILAAGAYGITQIGGSNASSARKVAYFGANTEVLPINRVIVTSVDTGSPADRAGMGPGDLIVAIDSRHIGDPGDVATAIAGRQPGDAITVRIQRGPLTFSTRVTLSARPANAPSP